MLNFSWSNQTKLPKYTTNDFIFRLKKIQKVVEKDEIDGLLILPGIDSKSSPEFIRLINWLFLGKNGLEIDQNEYLPEEYSEFIMIIKKKGVISVFLQPPLFEQLQSYLLIIPNIEIFCLTDKEYENQDELELLKISQFIKMVRGCKRLGVPLSKKEENSIKNIEKWPLIQAYGQADLGYGFFSLNHQIVNMNKRLDAIYKNHDKFSLVYLYYSICNRLNSHIYNSFSQINSTKFNKRVLLTENQLNEILKDAYEISELGKFINESEKTLPKPRVLFGKNTDLSYEKTSSLNENIKTSSHNKENYAYHATVEYSDIASRLRLGRTYFLHKNTRNEKYFKEIYDSMDDLIAYDMLIKQNECFNDEEVLLSLYLALVIGFYETLHGFAQNYKNLTNEFIEKTILKQINKVDSSLYTNYKFDKDNLNITLHAYNSMGDSVPIDFKDSISFKLTPYFFMLRVQLNNIKTVTNNEIIGSLLFCESFLLQENCFLLLTGEIPTIDFWNMRCELTDTISNMKNNTIINQLGKCLSKDDNCENIRFFFPHEKLSVYRFEVPIIRCKVILHEFGLKIFNDKIGCEIILFSDIKEVKILQKLDKPWLILRVDNNILLNSLKFDKICIEISGNSYKIYLKMREIFENLKIPYENFDEIPTYFNNSHLLRHESNIYIHDEFPQLNSMLKTQILDDKLLFSYLEAKQLVILNKLTDLKLNSYRTFYSEKKNLISIKNEDSEKKISIILINGSIGSGKKKFAENLIKFSNQSLKLHIVNFKMSEIEKLDEKEFISRIINFTIINKINPKDSIILAVQPSNLSTVKIIDYFETNKELNEKFLIKSIITKINMNNIFENNHKQFTKKLICYAIEGYSQFLMLDSYGMSEIKLDWIEKMIKSAYPNIPTFRIVNNIVSYGIFEDLVKFNQFNSEFNKFQRIKNLVFCDIPILEQEGFLFINYKIPFDKEKMQNIFFKNLMQKNEGYLYTEKTKNKEELEKILKSKDQFALEIYKLKEMISICQEQLNSLPHIKYVKGLIRYDNHLEDGIFEITITNNYFIERKIKNLEARVFVDKINENLEIKKVEYNNFNDYQELGFLFFGDYLEKNKILQFLKTLGTQMKQKINLKKKTDLTDKEIKYIEFENRGKLLEDGEFFDGSFFRDNYGNILKNHPKLDQLIDNYLLEENKKIIMKNEDIENEGKLYESLYNI